MSRSGLTPPRAVQHSSMRIAGVSGALGERDSVTFLPEPGYRELWCPIISADDHALEPAHLFEGRMPRQFADMAPHLVEDEEGLPFWEVDNSHIPITIANGSSGRPSREWNNSAQRFAEFRPGVSDSTARLADMDLNGVWASLCFPSLVWGFAGRVFAAMPDRELGLACVRAYNDWMIEEWCGPHPHRYIPCQIPWLADPVIAAHEIEVNARRGFRAVTFPETPDRLGFSSIYSGAWDPFFRACEETETVINLHVGSSGWVQRPSARKSGGGGGSTVPGERDVCAGGLALRPNPVALSSGQNRLFGGRCVLGADDAGTARPSLPACRRIGGMVAARPSSERRREAEFLVRFGGGPGRVPAARPDR